jgi:hypothetical protein
MRCRLPSGFYEQTLGVVAMPDEQPILGYQTPPTPNRRRRQFIRRLIVFSVIVVVLLGLLWVGLGLLGSVALYRMTTDTESLTMLQLESVGGFKFPPGTASVRSRYVSWMDFSLHLRFTIPPDQLDALLDGADIQRPLSSTQIPPQFPRDGGDLSWWTPGTPASFEAGSSTPAAAPATAPASAPAIHRYILIDKTDPKQFTIWMFMHDT